LNAPSPNVFQNVVLEINVSYVVRIFDARFPQVGWLANQLSTLELNSGTITPIKGKRDAALFSFPVLAV